jgi:hypothetical protein
MGTTISSAPRRTTVTLSPESLEIVERFKSANGASTSAAVDRLIKSTDPKPSRLKELNGVLVLSEAAKRRDRKIQVTLDDIKRIEDEMDRSYVERLWPRDKQRDRPARRARKKK